MAYHRPTEIPNEDELVGQFERGIRGLVRRFRNHPYAFYTASDMHCYLYHRLYKGGVFNGLYRTSEEHDTILLHKEFPTNSRYRRNEDKILATDPTGRRRGAFDISIWNPRTIGDFKHREQSVLCAAELALNECGSSSVHTVNDSIKLADEANDIAHGYLLFFVRDDTRRYEKNEATIWKALNEAAESVRVVFARVDGEEKPKPKYLGDWQTKR
ncbi:hypothetical protein BH23VER1_BH23VER1_13530 [soil metagenome]